MRTSSNEQRIQAISLHFDEPMNLSGRPDPVPSCAVGPAMRKPSTSPCALIRTLLLLVTLATWISTSSMTQAQSLPQQVDEWHPSAGKAFGLSMLLPGLGHRYVHDRKWTGWARTYAAADVSLWLGLIGGEWHRDQLVQSYTTLARGSADALVDGKDRTFYLNLASFRSSDEYRETMLRNRAWDRVDYVDDPAYQWSWNSESSYNRFRDLRDDAETLRRRRSILIASLVANRLISGAIAARSAGRSRRAQVTASLAPPVDELPVLSLNVRF